MNEVFNPSLVISLGNSGKKAIDFLDNMVKKFPDYLKNLIEFINIDDINLEELEDLIQKIIDKKLLSSKNINKLVDFGYKSRIYNYMDIKINIYFFWDLYDSPKKAEDIVNILYKINYGNIDKNKFWGVSLFIMPIIDKEWEYNEDCIKNSIENLKSVEIYISKPNNMVNINSKIFLLHSIAKDGARISRDELEYICASIAFLNIIPSTNPPLNSLKDKILKHEGKFKIGTIGIATLNIFKEEIMNYIKTRFKKDVIEYALTYKEKINYKDKFEQPIIDNNYINANLLKDIEFNNEDYIIDLEYNKLSNFIKKNVNFKKEDIFKNELKEWEQNFIEKYNNKIINKINFNQKQFCKEIKNNIKINLDSIIKKYSFMQGEDYLNTLYVRDNIKYYNNELENMNKRNMEKNLKIQKDFKRNSIKIILFNLLTTILSIYILSFNDYVKLSYKIIIIIIMLFGTSFFIYLKYQHNNNKLKISIKKYIKELKRNEQIKINNYLNKCIKECKDDIFKYIEYEKKCIYNYKECLKNNKIYKEIVLENNSIFLENFIDSLLNNKDIERFYNDNKNEVINIYKEYVADFNTFKQVTNEDTNNKLNKYVEKYSLFLINRSFCDFISFKWGQDSYNKVKEWMEKSLIKSKELLQYNEENNIQKSKMFLGSERFISSYEKQLKEVDNNIEFVSIKEKKDYINCVAIIKLSLGIELNSINCFKNLLNESKALNNK